MKIQLLLPQPGLWHLYLISGFTMCNKMMNWWIRYIQTYGKTWGLIFLSAILNVEWIGSNESNLYWCHFFFQNILMTNYVDFQRLYLLSILRVTLIIMPRYISKLYDIVSTLISSRLLAVSGSWYQICTSYREPSSPLPLGQTEKKS